MIIFQKISKNLNFIYLSQFNYIPNCSVIEYIANSNNPKYLKQNMYGKKIVVAMGAGSISNWIKELPSLMQ